MADRILTGKLHKMLSDCYPELVLEKAEVIESGWDNYIIDSGKGEIIRVPREDGNVAQLEREIGFLREVSGLLPLRVPEYSGSCRKNGKIVAASYTKLAGEMMRGNAIPESWNRVLQPWNEGVLERAASDLSSFLNALHSIPADIAKRNGGEIIEGRLRKQNMISFHRSVRNEVFPLLNGDIRKKVDDLFSSFIEERESFSYSPVVIHHDLENGNILWNPDSGEITGILDWGDFAVADPADDFAGFYYEYGEKFADSVLQEYRCSDRDGLKKRAVQYARGIPINNILFGIRTGNSAIRDRYLKYAEFL